MSDSIVTYIDEQKRLTNLAEQAADSEKRKSEELVYANEELQKEIFNRKRAEQDLLIAVEKAEHSNRVKSDFLANMSHELRTPLNHILGFTELILDKNFGELNEIQEEYLTDVYTSSNHLLDLINDILDLSKVEAGKLDFNPSKVHIRDILENSLVMIKQKALKHGIKVSTDFDGIPENITADERKLKQILYNLLSNAVKFTPDDGSIRLAAHRISNNAEMVRNRSHPAPDSIQPDSIQPDSIQPDSIQPNSIQIDVEDSGIGLKQEDLDRIFKPFEQVERTASRRFQGTGLGLSLTRSLVEMHGGKIWAESKGVDQGATFRFILPITMHPDKLENYNLS